MSIPIRARWRAAAVAAVLFASPLAAQETAAVAGRVLEPSGAPVAGADVVVEGTDRVVTTDADGRFRVSGLAPGRYTLRVERLGFVPRELPVDVGPGTTRLDIALEPRPIEVESLAVIGSPEELAEVKARMRQVPGGVDLIESAELRRTRQANFHDVLQLTPGVYAAPRFGAADETQLSIRGSGLRNNFHLRGVNILVNGMPYRNADGFTDFESLELLTVENIQVYKGANALRFGGSTLGGAINLETKTGYTADPFHAFAEGGSYGFFKGQLSSGGVHGDVDYYVSYARTDVDGFRDFSEQSRDRVNGHLGWVVTPSVDVRAFWFFAHVEEDLPGALTREELEVDPGTANPTNVTDRHGRDYDLHHVGVQLRTQLSADQRIDVAPYFQHRDIVHPIFRILDQTSRDFGVEVRYENTADLGGRDNRFTAGFLPAWGEIDNRHFENVGGESGALAKDQEDRAGTTGVYVEDVLALGPRFSVVLGLRYDRAWREVEDFFLEDGDQSDDRTFEAWMPKVGFLYELPEVAGQVFGNASRMFEPPLLLELNSLTVPGFIDLDAQDAWQFEVGARGAAGGWNWQVAAYDIEIDDEILNVNVRPFPDAPFTVPTYRNVAETRHYGLEVGLGHERAVSLLGDDALERIGFQVAYTFAKYEFVEDEAFSGNEIPGAPSHVLNVEGVYSHPSGLRLKPRFEWVPDDTFVDSANTVENDGWTVWGIRGEWELADLGALVFVEGRNLTDESYSPSVNVDDAAGRFFQPADGRSVYAGVRWNP